MSSKIAKDVPATALNMYEHICKIMQSAVNQHQSDELFLVEVFDCLRDGEFELAYTMKFGVSDEQWKLVPELIRVFLDSYNFPKRQSEFLLVD